MSFLPRRPVLALAALATLFAASCAAPLKPRGLGNDGLVVGRLKSVNPLEVAVPKVENASGQRNVPLEALRAEFQKGLVRLRYSPLALEYVDRNVQVTEASYAPGTLGEQASLKVVVTGWDTSRWNSHANLVVDLDVYLLDAAEPETSKALWGGHATRTVDLSGQRASFISEGAMLQRAVELAVEETLASLPARDAERGPTTR
jgi:hypothetical protein